MTGKELTMAIKAIAGADRRDVIEAIADLSAIGEIGKAEPAVRGVDSNLQGDGRTRSPRARELAVGPAFGASGGSTRGMAAEYDDLAEQLRSAGSATELGELLELPARMDRVEKNLRGQLGLIATIAEAAGRPDIAKAVASLLKAKAAEVEEEEEEEREGETADEKRENAKAALAGETILDGRLGDIFAALAGRGPAVVKAETVQGVLDDDGISLGAAMALASLANRRAAGVA
jgi:hypothetical protein